ncbi:MAG TPA: ImmA/IrrE family metallo-endopeptidase [Candidatus Levilactobacillus faecigallinarum]|uniref:ImmA/IrrE family metallo-endopeptidase n=1 Tax=Candidatus Levilactobacillus faecigallinarum TaxID=2838638 RepID=A0A9D1QUB6_9LACO|nr:ImmA/IrrE family metallo-endopeptidase [Candidatus Levilactobacillus faecigallinarum]
MQRKTIREIALNLVKEYQTNNPIELCACLGIPIHYDDLGKNVMGYRTKLFGVSSIVLNSRMDSEEIRLTCGHELGHDQCGHEDNADYLRKSSLYSRVLYGTEYEANCFMVELMLAENSLDDGVDTEEGVMRAVPIPMWAAPYVDWTYVKKELLVNKMAGSNI